jgi:hypothetical protein
MEFFKQSLEKEEMTNVELTAIVQQLVKENIDLKNRIMYLESREKIKIRKTVQSVLHEKHGMDFIDWLNEFNLTNEEFEYLNDYDYKECIQKVIRNRVKPNCPFFVFFDIKDTIYVYSNGEWKKMEKIMIKKIVIRIHEKYDDWYFDFSQKYDENEAKQTQIFHYLGKLDLCSIIGESVIHLYHKTLYSILSQYDEFSSKENVV